MNLATRGPRSIQRITSSLRTKWPTPLTSQIPHHQRKCNPTLWNIPYQYGQTHFSTQTIEEETSRPASTSLNSVLHKKASTRRTFSPNSNAQAMLLSGGIELAENASFDPIYSRARKYIRNHAVGPAVLSPILIHGLVGALIESTLPQSFFVENRLRQVRPLIVGVEVEAAYEVVSIVASDEVSRSGLGGDGEIDGFNHITRSAGNELVLETSVKRVSDGALIAEGQQVVWLPDYVST
jgi:hypothetical protein